ncbi:MAG: hypothetical protein N2259_01525 [Patescibacteria group bacterium]|nr:hypothetical protein [Patescibacteria group bacterium]
MKNKFNNPKTKKEKFTNKSSFTLVEMLTSVSIIAFVFLAATGIYTFSIGSQRKSAELSSLQQEANYLLSIIAKDIRAGLVDYLHYGSQIPSPTSTLALINYQTNQTVVYSFSSNKIMKNVGGSGDQPLTSSEVEVTDLKFYISPSQDPFTSNATTRIQPRVTIVLELKAKGQVFSLQQTVIQRYGERK